MQNTHEQDNKKKKRAIIFLLLLLLLAASLFWFLFMPKREEKTSLTVSAKLDTVNLSTFDNDQTKATALLNNIIVVVDDVIVTIDSENGVMVDGEVRYVDGPMTITIGNIQEDGIVNVDVYYQEAYATTNFNIVFVGPQRIARAVVNEAPKPEPTPEPSTPEPTPEPSTPEPTPEPSTPTPAPEPTPEPEKGNVIDAPVTVSPIRDINSESAQTPVDTKPADPVAGETVAVDPVDVATPVNNPVTVEEATNPAPTVAVVAYNKVSIIFENGDKMSLFKDGEGGKLVIMFKDGGYVNALNGNKVEFSVNDASGTVSFDMREMNASGEVLATSNGTYSK